MGNMYGNISFITGYFTLINLFLQNGFFSKSPTHLHALKTQFNSDSTFLIVSFRRGYRTDMFITVFHFIRCAYLIGTIQGRIQDFG